MMMKCTLMLAVAAAVAVAVSAAGRPMSTRFGTYIPTPAGYMLKECVHEVPSGATVTKMEDHTAVTMADGSVQRIEFCDTWNGERPMMLHTSHPDFPADYDGWLEYTVAKDDAGYETFLGDFSVPDTPQEDPDVLFLFTGLQNINWIPITTPLPSQNFDIIQPVLQYPSNFDPSSWSVRSWWVTLQSGAFASTEMLVKPGDAIFGNMTRTGMESYFVGSTSVETKKSTVTTYKNARLMNQPWAYNTLECYGCLSCATEPTKPCVFSKLALTNQNGPTTVDWKANPFPSHNRKCHESVTIYGSDAVTIGFQ